MKREPRAAQSPFWAMVAFALLGSLATACAPQAPEEPLVIETVDVAPPIDAELSTENDLEAVQRAVRIAGQVPGDVPPELPLFAPSSVIDFGSLAGGRAFLELDTEESPAVVRRWLGERLPAAGWTVGAIGDDLVQAHRGPQRVDYRLTDLSPGTRLRLEYPAR